MRRCVSLLEEVGGAVGGASGLEEVDTYLLMELTQPAVQLVTDDDPENKTSSACVCVNNIQIPSLCSTPSADDSIFFEFSSNLSTNNLNTLNVYKRMDPLTVILLHKPRPPVL